MTTTEQAGLLFGVPVQTKATEGGWGIEGYASTWELDEVGDVVEPGAFKESLTANPRPPLLWSHDISRVLGRAERLEETRDGLWGRWRISRTRDGEDARQLLLDEAVGGLSIGYRVRAGDYEHRGAVRHIKRLSLHEVSVVAMPANVRARVTRVKTAGADETQVLLREALERYVARLRRKALIAELSDKELRGYTHLLKYRMAQRLAGGR